MSNCDVIGYYALKGERIEIIAVMDYPENKVRYRFYGEKAHSTKIRFSEKGAYFLAEHKKVFFRDIKEEENAYEDEREYRWQENPEFELVYMNWTAGKTTARQAMKQLNFKTWRFLHMVNAYERENYIGNADDILIEKNGKSFEDIYLGWMKGKITAIQAMKILELKPDEFYKKIHELEAHQK